MNDRVAGLNAGADDCMVKPFALSELAARLAAILRRRQPQAPTINLQVADLEMNLLARAIYRGGQAVTPQPREFRLLEFFMQREDDAVTRNMLLEHVVEFYFDPNANIVESHISRLRDKLGRDQPELIHTIRNALVLFIISALTTDGFMTRELDVMVAGELAEVQADTGSADHAELQAVIDELVRQAPVSSTFSKIIPVLLSKP